MITLKRKDSRLEPSRDNASQKDPNINRRDLNDLKVDFKHKIISLTDDDLGSWGLIKKSLKQKFSTLTDEDLYLIEGHEDDLIDSLQRKIGNKQQELQSFIKTL